ncbi:hypothetical protein CMUS01_15242 [Colletotrichum musicola]|uniref:Uncharacterized protein n=1 Tax=Colletotrichum musicola TaxID=2175873 RepID=A0A8H6IXT9_9PEZI|nr:hypothetical protein CMUS01_15242 [Colletotrichum musicola]
MPCTCYFCAKVLYCFSEKSTRCRTCIVAKKPYNSMLVVSICTYAL